MLKKVRNVLSVSVLVILVLFVLFVTFQRISGKPPSIFGYQIYRVSSASMEPDLLVGDVILSKQVMANDLQIGDVVTYVGTEGQLKGKVITHAVVKKPYIKNDVYYIETQGVANGTLPDPPFSEEHLLGKMVCVIPLLNYLYSFFLTPYGLVAIIFLILMMFSGEIIYLIRLLINKEDKKQGLSEEQWERILDTVKEEEEKVKNREEKQKGKYFKDREKVVNKDDIIK